MSSLRSFFKHSASYFSGRLLILLAGLISLPITTRLLSKEDYGVMSLTFLAITITTSFAALGFPQGTTRYFAEYASKGPASLILFCSTMTAGASIIGILATIALFATSLFLRTTESFSAVADHLMYASLLVLVRLINSVCLQVLRGNQQTMAYNIFSVMNRYLTIGLIILLILYVYGDVTAVFVGTIYMESAILLVLIAYLHRRSLLSWVKPEITMIRRAIIFGVPLVVADLMVRLVASTDRYAIQYFLGPDAVATYAVAYDVSDYVATMFASPVQLAILPIVYALWSEHDAQSTERFLSKAINLCLIVVIPMIGGFAIVGPDVVTVLASQKYSDSAALIPIVALGVLIGSIHFLLFTGLLLHEKTRLITALNGSAAALNLLLNLGLIPMFGVVGAAYSTILTFVLLNVFTYLLSNKFLPVSLNWLLLGKAIIATAIMCGLLSIADNWTDYAVASVVLKASAGAVFYAAVMYVLDSDIRAIVHAGLSRIVFSRS